MNLSQIRPFLIHQFSSETELLRAIDEVSTKFTRQRSNIADYLSDPRLVSAYTAFYLVTNIPKMKAVMRWLPPGWIELLKKSDFIDLGSGPGTFSLAWKDLSPETQNFFQIEQSTLMKEQAAALWKGLHQSELLQSTRWSWKNGHEKFLFFGHSANEMGANSALDYIEEIGPEHILFIEPGTKSFFPEMLKLRNALITNGYNVLYPCPLPERCPMQGTENWCHQFVAVKQDDEVERLSQKLRLDRKLLPLTVQAFSKTYQTSNPKERVVRVLEETKFSFEWQVCVENNLDQYQVMKRDFSKSQTKEVGLIKAGDAVETEVVKTMETSRRVRLK